MNDDLRDLYQEVILDHSKNPRNFREMEGATRKVDGFNPLCGDKITLFLDLDGDVIKDISFKGMGCAISTASASMLTENLKGKTVDEANELFEGFRNLVTGEDEAEQNSELLGKLEVFAGIKEFPMRVKCATLSWHAFQAALGSEDESITTE